MSFCAGDPRRAEAARVPTVDGRSRRSRRRALATLVLLVGMFGAGAGSLRVPDPANATSGPAPRQAPGRVQLDLVDQDIAFGRDAPLRLVYRLSGDILDAVELLPPTTTTTTTTLPGTEPAPPAPGLEPPPPVELNLLVKNYPPLAPGADLERYVGRDPRLPASIEPVDGVVVADVRERAVYQDDGSVVFDLSIATDSGESVEDRIKFDGPGLYPVEVSLVVGTVDAGEEVARHGTIVQRLPGPGALGRQSAPIDLAVAAAIGELGPEPADGELDAARAELDAALALAASIESPTKLSVPPIVIDEAARDDQEVLAEALVDDGLVSLPADPLDVSSAAAAGIVEAFTRQLNDGEDLLTAALPTTPAQRDVWIATEPLSTAGAQVVRDHGYRYVVMTPTMFRATVGDELPATDLFVEISLPDDGTLPLLVVDELGEALTTETTDEILADEILADGVPVEWAVRTVGDLILDHERRGRFVERSRILATPDLAAPDPRLIRALEPLVATTPTIRFSPAGTLTGVTDVGRVDGQTATVQLPAEAGPDLTGRVASLDAAAVALLSAASMLPDDDERPAGWSERLNALLSTGYSEADVDDELDALLGEADRLKGSVVPPEPFTFTLTGRAGDIDLRIGNTADEPLKVQLRLTSPKLAFPEGEQVILLGPNQETLVIVPVRARANGTSPVNVAVLTPAGEMLDAPVVLTSRVNALTGFGQVLTGGFVLVLLTWWFSHWRRRRRAAALAQAGDVVGRHPSSGK